VTRAMQAAGQPATVSSSQVATLLAPFKDSSRVASYATQSLAEVVQLKIITGVTATALDPTANATRAQATVIVRRLLGYLGDL
jgi:glutamate racemase